MSSNWVRKYEDDNWLDKISVKFLFDPRDAGKNLTSFNVQENGHQVKNLHLMMIQHSSLNTCS